ncbi:MAG: hypothetical protein Q7R64_02420 [bacterium]|nr:hypothetical protein [bacterium]
MNIESLITLGYYVSSIAFLLATIISAGAARTFGKSALGSIFSYLCIGTGIFFIITVFQTLGSDFFGISHESVDIWWHLMFYLALFSYFFGFKALVGLASGNVEGGFIGKEKQWGLLALILLVTIFVIPSSAEGAVQAYLASPLAQLGLHHFLAFIVAGVVGSYLLSVKKDIGQIGIAVASPFILAVWSFSLQHLWELVTESWGVITLTGEQIEGVERIFLTISALCIIYAVIRLKAFAKK